METAELWRTHAAHLDDDVTFDDDEIPFTDDVLFDEDDGGLAVDPDLYQPPGGDDSFTLKAVEVKEAKVEVFRYEAQLAAEAVEKGRSGYLAHLWACSSQYVNTMGSIWLVFPEEMIVPDVPLALYRAALDTDKPVAALRLALNEGWSPRELRDHFDVIKGKHLSDTRFAGEADVVGWNVMEQVVTLSGLGISGNPPTRVRASLREVLEREN